MSKEWALVERSTWDHLNAVASSEIVLNPWIAVREATCTGLVRMSHNWPADRNSWNTWNRNKSCVWMDCRALQLSTKICTKCTWPISNCHFHMHELQSVVNSDLREAVLGCLVPCFGHVSPPARFFHFPTAVSDKVLTKIWTKHMFPMSN